MTSTTQKPLADLPRRLWTAGEFERAGDLGLFGPEERLELIEGEILVKMSPQGSRRAGVIDLVVDALRAVFTVGYVVRVQTPLALGSANRPEPDIAIVTGTARQYIAAHPTTAALVVEVSDSTLSLDRMLKAEVYAAASIPEYWIVNLVDDALEVYRNPLPSSTQTNAHYASVTRFIAGQSITPLAEPQQTIQVVDLLP